MISHEYECIFIHIPKCAGTSIESALGHLDNYKGRGEQDHRSIRMIEKPYITPTSLSSTENVRELVLRGRHFYRKGINPRNKLTVTKEQFDSYYKFTFVRNPWARAFSWYKNVIRDEIHQRDLGITAQTSFTEFLRQYAGKDLLKPQTHWLKSFDGSIPMDYVGRFENLTEDFETICKEMGIPPIELPHRIKGESSDYRTGYDGESAAIIADVYQEEIELFSYSFDSES